MKNKKKPDEATIKNATKLELKKIINNTELPVEIRRAAKRKLLNKGD